MTKEMMEEIEDLADVTHLVVMVEMEPLSDKYVQVLLTPDVFKKMSDLLWKSMPNSSKNEGGKVILIRPMEPVKIPDLESSYSEEFIKELTKDDRFSTSGDLYIQ